MSSHTGQLSFCGFAIGADILPTITDFLDHWALCCISQVNQPLRQAAAVHKLWIRLYDQRWRRLPGCNPSRDEFRLRHLAESNTAGIACPVPVCETFTFVLVVKQRLEPPSAPQQPVAPRRLEATHSKATLLSYFPAAKELRYRREMAAYPAQLAEYENQQDVFENQRTGVDQHGAYRLVFEGHVATQLADSSENAQIVIPNEAARQTESHVRASELRQLVHSLHGSLWVRRHSDNAMACLWDNQPADKWSEDAHAEFYGGEPMPLDFCPVDFVTRDTSFLDMNMPQISCDLLNGDYSDCCFFGAHLNLVEFDLLTYTATEPLEPLWPWPPARAKIAPMMEICDNGCEELSMQNLRDLMINPGMNWQR